MNEDCPLEPAEKDGLASGYPAGLPAIIINTESSLEFGDEHSTGELAVDLASDPSDEDPLIDYLSPNRMTNSLDGSNEFAGQSNNDRTCSKANAALKAACMVDTELERTITRAIMSSRVAAETAGFLEDVVEQQTDSPSSSPVSPSSGATEAVHASNDLPATNSRTATETNCIRRTVRVSACSSTPDATRQGVSLKHFDELVERSVKRSGKNSDGVRRTLNETSSNNSIERPLDDSSARTVLTQNTVRAHGNSIKTSNYSADPVPVNNNKQRDFASVDAESEILPDDSFIENVLGSHCATSVISQKPTGIRESSERKLLKEQAITSDDYEEAYDKAQRTVSGSSLINFIDSTIGDSADDLVSSIRPKSSSPDDVFDNESFPDCPNLVVNCDFENTQNSNGSAFLVNPSALASNLLLTTVDSADLAGTELLTDDLIKPVDETSGQAIHSTNSNQSNQSNPADPPFNRNSNNNNLLTTVLFISESSELTNDARSSTTGVSDSLNAGNLVDTSSLQTSKIATKSLLIGDIVPTTSGRTLTSSLPINARVLLIENFAQLNELASGQNLILTAPLLQKPADSKEKAHQPSSVISHCSALTTWSGPASKRPKKLRRQLAIDDSDQEPKSKPTFSEQPEGDPVLVIKKLNIVASSVDAEDNCLESSGEQVEKSGGEFKTAKSNREEGKADKEETADRKPEEKKRMLDATDFRGVLNAAAVLNAGLNAVAEHQSTYQLNGRLTPPSYGQHSTQSQLASQQYATLQPLPPISTMSDKFHDKFAHHYVLNSGNHGSSPSSAGNQSVISASNCASNAVHPGFALMPNTTLGKLNYSA